MIDETLPPSKPPNDRRSGARGGPPLPPVDQMSDTLHGFTPVTAPPAPAAPPDETHPKAVDRTLPPRPASGGTMVPGGPGPVLADPQPGTAPTVNAGPSEMTLGGHDPATQAYHKAALAEAPKSVTTGASFGHYELIETIAKGGMGVVYKARQRNLNRIVAIKMILAGQFADQTDIDRFYAEAEAAAALSHPNIVAIHEIGEVQGQHFFSMDYIDGQSLAALVQENPLRPRRAAEFVRTIAETMQFAHDSGVVHRDLKPANVLLDKRQRPLITDFGLAKHVSGQSQRTMAGSIVGTPSYMPPEQAAGKIDEIGPWSDLYSLGAILYELLTGRPPFRSASPFETVRQVLETEPLSPRLLNESVPKDLETICLKCLQKERTRRYASAQELADELGRFLRGEPIQARPISQVARFWRLCRRNPATASAIAAAVVMLFVALGGMTLAYVQSSRALAASVESQRMQMKAVNDWFTSVSDNTLLNQPGLQPLRKELYEKALASYQEFSKQRFSDPKLQDELGNSYFRIGQITEVLQSPDDALPFYEKARKLQTSLLAKRPKDADRLDALGNTVNALGTLWTKKRDFDAARADYSEAVRIRGELAAAHAANSEYQRVLANTHMNIGVAEFNAKNMPDARRGFEEAQRIRQAALKADPKNVRLRRDLAKAYYNLGYLDMTAGRLTEAESSFTGAIGVFQELAVEQPDDLDHRKLLAICYRLLGDLLGDDRAAEKRKCYEEALLRLEPLAQDNPGVVAYQTDRAAVLVSLSGLEARLGNAPEARTALARARDTYSALAARFSTVASYQRDLAVTLKDLGAMQFEGGDPSAALQNLNDSLRIVRELIEQYGKETYAAVEVATLRRLALVEQSEGDKPSALDHLEQAASSMRDLADQNRDAAHLFDLAVTLHELAHAQRAAGSEQSAGTLTEAINLLSDLVKQHPDDAEFKQHLEAAQKSNEPASP